jgi:SAM-dependent methyltransferase
MRFVRAAIRRVANELRESGFALDIGSGSGDVMAELRAVKLNVLGVDISPLAVNSVNHRFADDPKAVAETIDLESWKPTVGQFNIVTSITVLQHINDDAIPGVLANLRDCLTPEGVFLVMEIAPINTISADDQLSEVNERSATEWKTAFETAGLEIVHESTYAPLGPFAIHRFERLVDSVVSGLRKPSARPGFDALTFDDKRSPKRRLLGALIRTIRASILGLCWPFDYGLHLQMHKSLAYYRLFELKVRND